jgi:anti-sigma regulatory factor (Ser/Thr protein kinase)
MMTEISLNILDVAENSTKAGAALVTITVDADFEADQLTVSIEDNGCGMTPEQVERVTDPFFTSRTTRKVGLGVPFFKYAAESTGGSFQIESTIGVGTTVTATFTLSHIDRMPLGDINSTIHTLVVYHPDTDFVYHYRYNGKSFTMDTREFKEILGGISFDTPEISAYILEFLNENKLETDGGVQY